MTKKLGIAAENLGVITGGGEDIGPLLAESPPETLPPIVLSGIAQLDERLQGAERLARRMAVSPEEDALKAELALDSAWNIAQERKAHERDALMVLQSLLHLEMNSAGYSILCNEGLIDKPTRNLLNRLDIDIRTLEGHKGKKKFTREAEDKLDELRGEQERLHADLQDQITAYVRDALGRGGLSIAQDERYTQEMAELDDELNALKESPGVLDILNEWGQEAATAHTARVRKQKEDEFRAVAQEREAERELLKKLERAATATSNAQITTFRRLAALGDTPHLQNIVALIREPRAGYQSIRTNRELTAVRDMLVRSIIDGEGKARVSSPGEIVPWERGKSGRQYLDDMILLQSRDALALMKKYQPMARKLGTLYIEDHEEYRAAFDALGSHEKRAIAFVESVIQILHDDEMLRRIVGNKRERTSKAGKRIPIGAFWRAFETRKQNDISGETARRKEALRAEMKRIDEEAEREQHIRQSPYGFEVPGEGAILLEPVFAEKSRRNIWRVVDALGSKRILHELHISEKDGNTYLKDFSNAPRWLAAAAKKQGL